MPGHEEHWSAGMYFQVTEPHHLPHPYHASRPYNCTSNLRRRLLCTAWPTYFRTVEAEPDMHTRVTTIKQQHCRSPIDATLSAASW
jgi:hypothetical protein